MRRIRFFANLGHREALDFGQILPHKSINMELLQQSYSSIGVPARKTSLIRRFFGWCDAQEKYRFGWVASIVAGHGCVISPMTALLIAFSGNNMFFWALAIGAMAMSLISNLAAMPTKITIPVFFLSILIDLAVIINCILILVLQNG